MNFASYVRDFEFWKSFYILGQIFENCYHGMCEAKAVRSDSQKKKKEKIDVKFEENPPIMGKFVAFRGKMSISDPH